jgi:hypothetical protein
MEVVGRLLAGNGKPPEKKSPDDASMPGQSVSFCRGFQKSKL